MACGHGLKVVWVEGVVIITYKGVGMKKIALAATVLSTLSCAAYAQSNVTVYGIVDASVRYSTNENAAGGSKLQEAGGPLSGSRIGFKGTEDLGGGLSALFSLESGLAPTPVHCNNNRRPAHACSDARHWLVCRAISASSRWDASTPSFMT